MNFLLFLDRGRLGKIIGANVNMEVLVKMAVEVAAKVGCVGVVVASGAVINVGVNFTRRVGRIL